MARIQSSFDVEKRVSISMTYLPYVSKSSVKTVLENFKEKIPKYVRAGVWR